jgi:hypothetical protein
LCPSLDLLQKFLLLFVRHPARISRIKSLHSKVRVYFGERWPWRGQGTPEVRVFAVCVVHVLFLRNAHAEGDEKCTWIAKDATGGLA